MMVLVTCTLEEIAVVKTYACAVPYTLVMIGRLLTTSSRLWKARVLSTKALIALTASATIAGSMSLGARAFGSIMGTSMSFRNSVPDGKFGLEGLARMEYEKFKICLMNGR